MKKTDGQAAYYEILDEEAAVVRMAYQLFTVEQRSIGAITRTLNERSISTRTGGWKDGAKAPAESDSCAAAEGWVLAALPGPIRSDLARSGSRSPCRR